MVAEIFMASQCVAIVRLAWIRFRYPFFVAALVCWLGQAINCNLMPGTDWVRRMWMPAEILVIVTTTAACIEAINRARSFVFNPFLRFELGCASMAIPSCLTGMGILFVAPIQGDSLEAFKIVRSWAWATLALGMLITAGLLALERITMPITVKLHLWLLTLILVAHACLSWYSGEMQDTKQAMRMAYRLVVIACCGMWCFMRREKSNV